MLAKAVSETSLVSPSIVTPMNWEIPEWRSLKARAAVRIAQEYLYALFAGGHLGCQNADPSFSTCLCALKQDNTNPKLSAKKPRSGLGLQDRRGQSYNH